MYMLVNISLKIYFGLGWDPLSVPEIVSVMKIEMKLQKFAWIMSIIFSLSKKIKHAQCHVSCAWAWNYKNCMF